MGILCFPSFQPEYVRLQNSDWTSGCPGQYVLVTSGLSVNGFKTGPHILVQVILWVPLEFSQFWEQ